MRWAAELGSIAGRIAVFVIRRMGARTTVNAFFGSNIFVTALRSTINRFADFRFAVLGV